MASRGKKKTTFAKLAREAKLRERRMDKQVRKEARRNSAEFEVEQQAEAPDATETVRAEDAA